MVSISEKSKFVAESLVSVINKDSIHFKESKRKLLKSAKNNGEYHIITGIMKEAIVKSIKVIHEWEEKSFPELGGLTPKQYFDSLTNINDIVELVSLLEEKNNDILPTGLSERIKRFDDKFSNDLLNVL